MFICRFKKGDGTLEVSEECKRLQVRHRPDGMEIHLLPGGPTFDLHQDGDVLYQMNEQGQNVGVYKWPREEKR